MRWSLLLAAVFLLGLPAASSEPLGCCVPSVGQCFDSGTFDSPDAFQDACEQAGDAQIRGAGEHETCQPYQDLCQLGCCCASPDVFDSPTINSNEELLHITNYACSLKDGFTFNALPPGSSCVDVCGGTPDDPGERPDGTHAVSGNVVNASNGEPLANADVFVPLEGGDISTKSSQDGTFSLDVPAIRTRIFAVHAECQPGQSRPVLVDRDLDGVEVPLTCELQACEHLPPSFADGPRMKPGTDTVTFALSVEDACQDFVQFEPLRCVGEDCQALEPGGPVFEDMGLEPGTTYCYRASARFLNGLVVENPEEACITTGAAECMQDTGARWCGSAEGVPAVLSCDQENRLQSETCEAEQICSARSGQPECVPAPSCEKCNGFLGLFARLFGGLELPFGLLTKPCSEACVLDTEINDRPLTVEAYKSCLAVGNCSDYRSRQACEQDACGLSSCSWTDVNEELGLGLCSDGPACEQCDALGFCTKKMCESIGNECYYDGQGNGLSETRGCTAEIACRYYDTQEDCVGSGDNAVFDVTYTDGARSGGTNRLVSPSDDRLGLGVCSWTGTACIKDADMQHNGEDDCIENGRFFSDPECVTDVTPPTTQLFLTDPPAYARNTIRTLPFSADDDRGGNVTTYVCFGEGCYPDETLSTVALPETGTHTVRFYSEDASGNLEAVQEAEIIVGESEEPAIEDITIEENR